MRSRELAERIPAELLGYARVWYGRIDVETARKASRYAGAAVAGPFRRMVDALESWVMWEGVGSSTRWQ